jgi:thiamine kinase-like enzyme
MSDLLSPALQSDLNAHTGALHRVMPISGGITNSNYRLDAERGRFMLRLAGERTQLLGINRAHEYGCATTAHQVGVGAEPIAYLKDHAAILTRFIDDAQTLTPESAAPRLERIVPMLKRYHAAPAFPSRFDPFETVRHYRTLALEHGVKLPTNLPEILGHTTQIETALRPHAQDCACHNDLLPANFLDDGMNIWIVDWEYAGNGNMFFDLGNFAVNLELDGVQCEQLVRLYFGHSSELLLAQLHLMRLASDLREAFWGFLQSGISTLEFDFIGYGEKHLERFRGNVARAEYARWLEVLEEIPPLR